MIQKNGVFHVLMEVRDDRALELFEVDVEARSAKSAVTRVRELWTEARNLDAPLGRRLKVRPLDVLSVARVVEDTPEPQLTARKPFSRA